MDALLENALQFAMLVVLIAVPVMIGLLIYVVIRTIREEF